MKCRRLTPVARELRSKQTDAENLLWARLRSKRLEGVAFRRQVPLDGYVVDFCSLQERLVVELDGGQHTEKSGEDRIRSERIQIEGFRVIRFWDHEVLNDLEAVLLKIQEAI
jgi:very-short-patch-repair endonuclease